MNLPRLGLSTRLTVCSTCYATRSIDRDTVDCVVSGTCVSLRFGQCKLRKWPANRAQLPPLWILAHERTGSTHLASMLDSLGFTPPLKEWHHPTRYPDAPRIPLNIKTHPSHFKRQEISLGDVVREYPDTRFLVVRRRGLIAASVSRYLAIKTTVWARSLSARIRTARSMSMNTTIWADPLRMWSIPPEPGSTRLSVA